MDRFIDGINPLTIKKHLCRMGQKYSPSGDPYHIISTPDLRDPH